MIGNSENRISYNGNGSATEFSYQFRILNKSDIKVLLVDSKGKETLLTKDYYVDTEKSVVHYPGYAPGADIPEAQRPPVLPNGWKLILYREVPVTQESRLDEYWPFNVIESMADKLTIICQQLLDGVSRSIKISEGSKSGIDTVIDVAPNKGLKWNAEGTKIVPTEDPATVLPQANDVLKQAEAARDKAVQKADAAAESALSAADSEINATTAMNKARAWAEGHEPGGTDTKSSKEWAINAKTKATEATEQAQLAKWWAQGHMPENNPENQSAKEWATAAKIHANTAQEKSEIATQKATESLTSANKAKASETAAKSSETNASNSADTATTKASEASASANKAKTSETNAGTAANKATTEANRAKTEADRAQNAADSVGNPVVNVTSSGGTLTVIKGDGSSSNLTVAPPVATQAEATAGTDNTKIMTPLRVKESIKTNAPVKSVNGVVAGDNGDVSVGLLNGDADTKGIKQFRCFSRSGESRSYWYLGSTPANTTGAEDLRAQIVSLRVSSVGDFGGRDLADYEVYITPRYATPSILAFSNKPMSETRTLKCGYVINGENVDWYIVSPPWTSPFYVSYLTAPDSPELSYPFNRPENITYVTQRPANFVDGEIIVTSNQPTISAGTNGWTRDSATGFTIQWGTVTSAQRQQTVTFPRTFSKVFNVIATMRGMGTGSQSCKYVLGITNTTFQAGSYDASNGYAGFTWVAFGIS